MYVTNATPSDVPLLIDKMGRTLGRLYEPGMLINLINLWPRGCLVMRFANNINGFIIGVKDKPNNAKVLYLGVEKKYRNQGFGTRLMQKFIKQCMIEGIYTARLEVTTDNFPAQRFYRKLGFNIERRLPGFYEDGGDGYSLVRYL